MTPWLPLLGMTLVTPLMLLSTQFPLADHSRNAFASVAVAPVVGFIKHVVLGPLLEEIIYRGLLLQLARRYMPTWWAIGLSAALFGATHFLGGPALVVSAVLMAVLFGWIAVRARSLYASFLCHSAFNFSAGFIIAPLFNITEKLRAVPAGERMVNPMTLMPG